MRVERHDLSVAFADDDGDQRAPRRAVAQGLVIVRAPAVERPQVDRAGVIPARGDAPPGARLDACVRRIRTSVWAHVGPHLAPAGIAPAREDGHLGETTAAHQAQEQPPHKRTPTAKTPPSSTPWVPPTRTPSAVATADRSGAPSAAPSPTRTGPQL